MKPLQERIASYLPRVLSRFADGAPASRLDAFPAGVLPADISGSTDLAELP